MRASARVRAAEKSVASFRERHKATTPRTIKSHHQVLANLMLAKNDLTVLENMLKRECERAAEVV